MAAAPLELGDRPSLCFDCWHALPSLVIGGTLRGELLAFPHDDESFLGSAGYDSSLGVVLNGHDLVVDDLAFEGRRSQGQDVVLVVLDVEHSDHVFTGNCGEEPIAGPDCGQVVDVARDGKLHFSIRHELLREVQLELDEEQMRGDDDHRVLFLVEQDGFHATWHFADLGAVLEIIGEADGSRGPSEEKERIRIILLLLLVHDERAEDDLANSALLLVRTDLGETPMGSPNSHSASLITCDHS